MIVKSSIVVVLLACNHTTFLNRLDTDLSFERMSAAVGLASVTLSTLCSSLFFVANCLALFDAVKRCDASLSFFRITLHFLVASLGLQPLGLQPLGLQPLESCTDSALDCILRHLRGR